MEPLTRIDLNLLVALDALLQERSVTRAGERLAVTQPTMSGALARLRALFGDELLIRTGRTMVPTPLAETLERPVRAILAQIEETVLARAEFDAGPSPTFPGCRPTTRRWSSSAGSSRRSSGSRPGSGSASRPGGLEDPAGRLQRGEIDLAIVPSRFSEPTNLPAERLFSDRFVAAAWRENAEVSDPLTWEEFHRLPYLSYRLGPLPRWPTRCSRSSGTRARSTRWSRASWSACSAARHAPDHLPAGAPCAGARDGRRAATTHAAAVIPAAGRDDGVAPGVRDSDPAHRWLRAHMREVAHFLNRIQNCRKVRAMKRICPIAGVAVGAPADPIHGAGEPSPPTPSCAAAPSARSTRRSRSSARSPSATGRSSTPAAPACGGSSASGRRCRTSTAGP